MSLSFNHKIFDDLKEAYKKWQEQFDLALAGRPERDWRFTTVSDRPIKRIYSPADVQGQDFVKDIGFPGDYPFTRGVQPSMYRLRHLAAGRLGARGAGQRVPVVLEDDHACQPVERIKGDGGALL